jgi:putative transposase
MEGKRYPSDLSDQEWEILEPLLPLPKPGGRPRSVNLREVMNVVFYVLRGGIPWRFLPKECPPWKTVYHYFRLWRRDGYLGDGEHQVAGAGVSPIRSRSHPQRWSHG